MVAWLCEDDIMVNFRIHFDKPGRLVNFYPVEGIPSNYNGRNALNNWCIVWISCNDGKFLPLRHNDSGADQRESNTEQDSILKPFEVRNGDYLIWRESRALGFA